MTSTSVIPFDFNSHPVRIVMLDGEPWFVATDVAEALGYRDAHNAARFLTANQKGTHNASTPSGDQRVTLINESGLYRLVLRSRKPEAVAFSDWVTGTVLPSIRKTGHYTHAAPKANVPLALPAITATSIRSAIEASGADPVALPDTVNAAIDAKSAAFAVEMMAITRQYLARRVADSALSGYPKPSLDVDAALEAIAETTLGEVLTPHYCAQLRMLRTLSQAFAATACTVRDQIENQFPSALPVTAMEASA